MGRFVSTPRNVDLPIRRLGVIRLIRLRLLVRTLASLHRALMYGRYLSSLREALLRRVLMALGRNLNLIVCILGTLLLRRIRRIRPK